MRARTVCSRLAIVPGEAERKEGSDMDQTLVAWARAVKARQSKRAGAAPGHLPPIWVFSDWQRLPDPAIVLRRLPPLLCGLVLRPDKAASAREIRMIARLCRARRVMLTIAGWDVAGCGVHMGSAARRPRSRRAAFITASAHDRAELVRARRVAARLVFVSPVFVTASHPGAVGLGVLRWAALVRRAGVSVAALGGINGGTVRRLPRDAQAVGMITAALDG